MYNKNLDRSNLNGERPMTKAKLQKALNPKVGDYFPKRHGIDFFNHYKEDIKLFGEMNMQWFRMSISWARIFPNGDDKVPNEAGLKFYENVFQECEKYGIKPLVTISHYDTPYNLVEKYGGWKNPQLIEFYKVYAKLVFERYKKYVIHWMPFNEINAAIYSVWAGAGLIDDGEANLSQASYQAMHNLFVANAWAVKIGHEVNPKNQIGCMVAHMTSYPATCKPEDVIHATKEHQERVLFYYDVMCKGEYPKFMLKKFEKEKLQLKFEPADLELLKKYTLDYIGFSYYMSGTSGVDNGQKTEGNLVTFGKNPFLKASEWGWQIDPQGIRYTMNDLYFRYNLPLVVAENGIGVIENLDKNNEIHDDYRIDYLSQHINEMSKAINEDGVEVLGYTLWTPIDVISHGTSEMSKRYGLIYVDQDDLGQGTKKRFKKNSFYWYQKLIKSNVENF
ncbi:6-phospho-beta-glucosidase [Spiroplasma alleghenense]|uniref:6-phospho-beta-glucosidase n=2 Tax=Spiroplasma alleghenense TaxID=216931 RepID=A0A345Z4S0_9MOLU|nr:6-phospho-beta-glucosidase [Spiroplasma alleghenense]